MGFKDFFQQFTLASILQFNTPRYIKIKSYKLGLVFRLIQITIIFCLVGFVLIYKKGYQDRGLAFSTVVTKVKGIGNTNTDAELNVPHSELYKRIWDPSDYVVPPYGGDNGGFFIMTNVVITPNQTRGSCPEDPDEVKESICLDDSHCELDKMIDTGNGVQTGRCVQSNRHTDIKTCEIFAWCPVEQEILPFNGTQALLRQAKSFTILIKNTVSFPRFGEEFQKRNILETANQTYLQHCTYDKEENKFCPIFRIKDVVEDFDEVAIRGGVYVIRIKWNCNLDLDFEQNCRPKYEFQRMDNKNAHVSRGWNFRYAEYNGENERTLYKKFGLKFVIEVSGWGGKFNIVPLVQKIGSGLGLLGLAQLFAGLLVSYCVEDDKLDEIKKKKYWNIVDENSAFPFNSKQNEENDYAQVATDPPSHENTDKDKD